jgi:hypothetical protein
MIGVDGDAGGDGSCSSCEYSLVVGNVTSSTATAMGASGCDVESSVVAGAFSSCREAFS